jgi:subtilase family serine protease
VPAGLSASEVAKAIKVGIMRRGWVVSKDQNGQIDAVLNVRKHSAHVAIPYDDKEVRIKYVSSDNLDYQEKNGERYIHGNYVKWVRNMQADIQRELQLLTVK